MDEPRLSPDDAHPDADEEVMLRPDASVLGDESLVPDTNIIDPPPNHFTHEVVADEPYRFDRDPPGGKADGVLRAGTRVIVLVEGGGRSRVADGDGLYVEVPSASLRRLPGGQTD